jgi:pimeloyl-ACP methyl ester carboxylesterase
MISDTVDYSALDRPEVLMYLFHPRPDWGGSPSAGTASDILIPVEKAVAVGARFHMTQKSSPNILFFHGNGEIVSDYDDLGPMYNRMDINFLAVDYRGYGRSTGNPTVSDMMKDCHFIFDFVSGWLDEKGYSGPMIVMGRSLGSASALELAAAYTKRIDGLIIESGFAYAAPLLRLLGVDPEGIGFEETRGFRNIDKIKVFTNPTLIIHAAKDHIIPFSDGQALYDASGSTDKRLLEIPNANHNDIFLRGLQDYLAAVKALMEKIG